MSIFCHDHADVIINFQDICIFASDLIITLNNSK